MLMSIMYHHANSDRCSNDLAQLDAHFAHISAHFDSVFPGESVHRDSVCITFDDAYADFYFLVYPLLQKYRLKALLAVPSRYILDNTTTDAATRMGFEHNELFAHYQTGTFCTYTELREMVSSGLVQIASHSHSHVNLLEQGVNLEQELAGSQAILREKIGVPVESFVFPFGKYNPSILTLAKQHYRHVFRIGNAIHPTFEGINGVIYRVNGDGLTAPDELFRPLNLLKFRAKGWLKRLARE